MILIQAVLLLLFLNLGRCFFNNAKHSNGLFCEVAFLTQNLIKGMELFGAISLICKYFVSNFGRRCR